MPKSVHPQKIQLMIPGPSEPEPEVVAALMMPVMAHYGQAWSQVYHESLEKLQRVFKTKNEVILLPSPGQTAVEMAVSSLIKRGDEAFVCSNGFFSDMICEMLSYYGVKPRLIKAEKGKPIRAENVRASVQAVRKKSKNYPKCLFLVHNETSTGLTNPAPEIMKVCREEGLISILDSISGFGGIDVRADEWHVDYCVGYASKAIGGIFGVTPVSISNNAWKLAKKIDSKQGRFLNLNVWRHYIDEWASIGHPHPSTMPTNVIIALSKALDLIFDEGLERRYKRHADTARFIEDGLERLGLPLFPEKSFASNTVTAAQTDPKLNPRLRRLLLEKYGIMISDGLGDLSGKIVRIGHMGASATIPAVSTTLAAIGEIVRS
jgi:aspartate aminotransferase-like enzyme